MRFHGALFALGSLARNWQVIPLRAWLRFLAFFVCFPPFRRQFRPHDRHPGFMAGHLREEILPGRLGGSRGWWRRPEPTRGSFARGAGVVRAAPVPARGRHCGWSPGLEIDTAQAVAHRARSRGLDARVDAGTKGFEYRHAPLPDSLKPENHLESGRHSLDSGGIAENVMAPRHTPSSDRELL